MSRRARSRFAQWVGLPDARFDAVLATTVVRGGRGEAVLIDSLGRATPDVSRGHGRGAGGGGY